MRMIPNLIENINKRRDIMRGKNQIEILDLKSTTIEMKNLLSSVQLLCHV